MSDHTKGPRECTGKLDCFQDFKCPLHEAAPALLAALRWALPYVFEWAEGRDTEINDAEIRKLQVAFDSELSLAREAIRLAEGRTE